MKTLKIFIILLVLATGAAHAQFTRAELQVSGLTCALCANATQKALKKLPFISDIKPDLIRNVFVLTFNGQPVDFDLISKKVQDAGFFVNSFKTTFNFDKVSVASNSFSYDGNTYEVVNAAGKAFTGPVMLTIIDKGFAPRSVSKKYLAQVSDVPAKSGRIYHLAI